jgi:UDP-N-acetylglucosamine transferase subunit ALG13
MILVTLGTQKEQFTRLLDYIENSNIKDKIIVQAGHTKYKSKKMEIFDFIPYDKMDEYINDADLVITHSGTGSVLTPLKKGK